MILRAIILVDAGVLDRLHGAATMVTAAQLEAVEPAENTSLIAESRRFAVEDKARTWRLFITTSIAGIVLAAVAALPYAWSWIASAVLGLVIVRMFIFYHDCLHGAIFRRSKLGHALMEVFGWWVLTPSRVWKDTHNYHHAHNAKLVGSSIGSFPVVTVRMYRHMNRTQRFAYRATRHPLTIVFGYLTLFMWGMCLRPFIANPKRNWGAIPALLLHFSAIALCVFFGGWIVALKVVIVPLAVSQATGSYLFYAQHNYPDVKLRDRSQWKFEDAAVESASYMSGGPIMRWFTGDIGYHHVHHLNSAIPFYRLEEAMNEIPGLANPGHTTLSLKDIWACLRLDLWDPSQNRMVSFRDLPKAKH